MKKKLLVLLVSLSLFACEVDNTLLLDPFVSTYEPENILSTSAVLSGEALGEGGSRISEYGLVWSSTLPPTINDNKSVEGERIGFFSRTVTGLQPGSTYYCSAYAINDIGISYGDIWEFTTTTEAPCVTQENYLDAQSVLSVPSGNYNTTQLVLSGGGPIGGDYYFQADNGGVSAVYTELRVFFNGNPEDLLPGSYAIVNDLDDDPQRVDQAAIQFRYSSFYFIPPDGGTVYVERDENNNVIIKLCDVLVRGSIDLDSYEITLTTQFEVAN